jgi:hypothetical protein
MPANDVGKTEYEIDTWSYRRGLLDGFIPSDVSNASTFAFPLRQDGCIDDQYDYQASPSGAGRSVQSRLVTTLAVVMCCIIMLQVLS